MLMLARALALSLTLVSATVAFASPTYRTITQFPNGTFVENIGVRHDGSLLLTTLTGPELWSVDPYTGSTSIVATFPNATSTVGLAQYSLDIWAVAVGKINMSAFEGIPGTFGIWLVDFNHPKKPRVVKQVPVPAAQDLNGLACCDVRGRLLAADSNAGIIYAVDVYSGVSEPILSGPAFAHPVGGFPIGVNGVRILPKENPDTLFFTNSAGAVLSRASLSSKDDVQTIVGPDFAGVDDFALVPRALSRKTLAFVAFNNGNQLLRVTRDGKTDVVLGAQDSAVLPGPTSAQLSHDGHTLYVTTYGLGGNPINGTFSEGPRVIAVDVQHLI
ncbi:hypothetical protein EXIGLDRAFT_718727 [Exidia glandulosa HHB12029]|uniref:NHL repeat-containing protein n=1 Tax=Exidia glandulosa HHB12029 TaxID=1314781 RepID=A0A165HL97_EXIGL|nr:hypothetical protein EXIGLDRAFT_718727 [Exidia glandulosa HHB12029]